MRWLQRPPQATHIFSHDDLTINGSGSLTVNANYNNGIVSKDDLKITGGTITVTAVNDAVKGRDSLTVKDGALTVKAGGDGMQATNDEEADRGNIVIEGGSEPAGSAGDCARHRLIILCNQNPHTILPEPQRVAPAPAKPVA